MKDKILLAYKDIQDYNEVIRSKTDNLYDLNNILKISKLEILDLINTYKYPVTKNILENRNINNIVNLNSMPKGIIVKRANLRSFPTDIHFYDNKCFDRIQETELHVNTEVLILHESLDSRWNFVIAQNYYGWVKNENIAIATDDDINFFIKNKKFSIVIEPNIKVNDVVLDMSVKLPYINENEDSYVLALPTKDKKGYVKRASISISKDKINIGYLPYTKENLYKQALKYLGVSYSWGGMEGIDCSGYISNIYRTFGFIFPRNVSSQSISVGKIIDISNKTLDEKLDILNGKAPALLFKNDHTMLYLGVYKNKHYMIHAPGGKKVEITELNNSSEYLKEIYKIVLIEKD